MPNVRRLAEFLQELRDVLTEKRGIDTPVYISSGYRCFALNVAIGGSARSKHMSALCADITVPGMSTLELALFIQGSMGGKYDQLIHEFGRWVHVGLSEVDLRGQSMTSKHDSEGNTIYLPGLLRVA